MKQLLVLSLAVLALAGAVMPVTVEAQKARRVAQGPDADGDGVADAQDQCAATPPNTRVNDRGCPVTLMRPGQAPASQPAATQGARPDSSRTRAQGGDSGAARGVVPQSAGAANPATPNPAGARPAGADSVTRVRRGAPPPPLTGGLALDLPEGDADAVYLRRFARLLDSTIISVVGVFRNTSGQPMSGAAEPTALSQRERDRWDRCRNLHFDLTTYPRGLEAIRESPALSFDDNVVFGQAVAELDSALRASESTVECDNISSMITAPGRWTPWGPQYEAAARAFYGNWYAELRGIHEKLRAFIVAFNGVADDAERIRLPPALQRNSPYAGAAPR